MVMTIANHSWLRGNLFVGREAITRAREISTMGRNGTLEYNYQVHQLDHSVAGWAPVAVVCCFFEYAASGEKIIESGCRIVRCE